MEIKEMIMGSERLIESPIRAFVRETKGVTLFEAEKGVLNEIDRIVKTSKENLNSRLKIAILGEVKAGKSTLVNALIGKKVSYTNVVEATANILEIEYAENDEIIIYKEEGQERKLDSLEKLDKLISDNANNQEFFKNITKILLRTKTERLKEISVVDTPGLNTITTENAERTENYLASADVIIWVLSAHHLGQADIEEKIEEVMNYNKPLVCIVNRKDEVQANEEELVEFVDDTLGYMFDKIFATSAKAAWDGQVENNSEKLKSSNIIEVYEYIVNNIEHNVDEVQEKSVKDTLQKQINRDVYEHKKSLKKIDTLIKRIDEDVLEINKFDIEIKKVMVGKANEWMEYEFFQEEKKKLINADKRELKEIIQKITDKSYIEELINKECESLNNYLHNEWKNNTEAILNKQSEFHIDMRNTIDVNGSAMDGEDSSSIAEGAKKGTAAGAAAAIGIAGYAAWLGPAAAYVSIGSAMAAFVPPLLIAGLLGGIVYKFVGGDKEEKNRISSIENMVNEIRREVRNSALPCIIESLEIASEKYKNQSIDVIYQILEQCNTDYNEIKKMKNDIEIYIGKISVYEKETVAVEIKRNI